MKKLSISTWDLHKWSVYIQQQVTREIREVMNTFTWHVVTVVSSLVHYLVHCHFHLSLRLSCGNVQDSDMYAIQPCLHSLVSRPSHNHLLPHVHCCQTIGVLWWHSKGENIGHKLQGSLYGVSPNMRIGFSTELKLSGLSKLVVTAKTQTCPLRPSPLCP